MVWIWGWEALLCAESGTFHSLSLLSPLAPSLIVLTSSALAWAAHLPGPSSRFLSTLAALGCLLQAHFPAGGAGRLWFCHIPSQNVLMISHPRRSLDQEPLSISPAHTAASEGITLLFPHCDLVPTGPAQAHGPLRLLPSSISLSAASLFSSSLSSSPSLPLPSHNPQCPSPAPWYLTSRVAEPHCAEPLLEPCSGHGTLRLHSTGREGLGQSPELRGQCWGAELPV